MPLPDGFEILLDGDSPVSAPPAPPPVRTTAPAPATRAASAPAPQYPRGFELVLDGDDGPSPQPSPPSTSQAAATAPIWTPPANFELLADGDLQQPATTAQSTTPRTATLNAPPATEWTPPRGFEILVDGDSAQASPPQAPLATNLQLPKIPLAISPSPIPEPGYVDAGPDEVPEWQRRAQAHLASRQAAIAPPQDWLGKEFGVPPPQPQATTPEGEALILEAFRAQYGPKAAPPPADFTFSAPSVGPEPSAYGGGGQRPVNPTTGIPRVAPMPMEQQAQGVLPEQTSDTAADILAKGLADQSFIENASSSTGNTLAGIGQGVVGLVSPETGQRMQRDAEATYGRPEPGSAGDVAGSILGNALAAAPGVAATVAGAPVVAGGALVTMAASTGGNKRIEILEKRRGGQQVSGMSEATDVTLNAAAEAIGELFGMKVVGGFWKASTKFIPALRTAVEAGDTAAVRTLMGQIGKETGKLAGGGAIEESLTQVMQNSADRFTGVDPQKDLLEGVERAAFEGAATELLLGAPGIVQSARSRAERSDQHHIIQPAPRAPASPPPASAPPVAPPLPPPPTASVTPPAPPSAPTAADDLGAIANDMAEDQYAQAVQVVREANHAGLSLLKNKLNISVQEARSHILRMVAQGVVSRDQNGALTVNRPAEDPNDIERQLEQATQQGSEQQQQFAEEGPIITPEEQAALLADEAPPEPKYPPGFQLIQDGDAPPVQPPAPIDAMQEMRNRFLRDDITVPNDDPREGRPTMVGPGVAMKVVQQNNLTEALPQSTAAVFHETSTPGARSLFIRTEQGPRRHEGIWVSDNADLALGQGGRGVLIEFDPTHANGARFTQPGKAAAAALGQGEEFKIEKTLPGAIRSMTFKTQSQLEAMRKIPAVAKQFDFENAVQTERGLRVVRRGQSAPPPTVSALATGPTSAEESTPPTRSQMPVVEPPGQTVTPTTPAATGGQIVAPKRQPVKPRTTRAFSRSDIEAQLVRHYDEFNAASDSEQAVQDERAGEAIGGGVTTFPRNPKTRSGYPEDIENAFTKDEFRQLRARGIIKLADPSRSISGATNAGAEDAMAEVGGMGIDKYVAMLRRRLSDTGVGKLRNAIGFASRSDNPQMQLLAFLHAKMPAAKDKPAQQVLDLKAQPVGTKFRWTDHDFEIVEDADGNRLLRDGEEFPVLPVEYLDQMPVNRGSVKHEEPEVPEGDFTAGLEDREPWQMTRAEIAKTIGPRTWNQQDPNFQDMHRAAVEQAIAAGEPVPPAVLADYPDLQPKPKFYEGTSPQQTGVFGQGVTFKDTGSQQSLIFETDRKPIAGGAIPGGTAADEKIAKQFDAQATPEMFPPEPEGTGPAASPSRSSIVVTGNELTADPNPAAVRAAARLYAKTQLQGRSFVNRDTGRTIQITGGGLRKGLSNTGDIRRAKVIVALPKMLEEARFVRSEEPHGAHEQNIRAFHRFQVEIDYARKPETLKLLVREDNNGHLYYNHDFGEVLGVEKKEGSPVSPGGTTQVKSQTAPAGGEPTAKDTTRPPAREGEVPPEPEGRGPSGAPSHAFAQPKNMAGTGEVKVTSRDIIKKLEEITGTPIRVGHGWFKQRKAAGWFSPTRDLIRTEHAESLDVSAHEAGHAIHQKVIGWKTPWPRPVADELAKMGKELYGSRVPNAGYRREGLAEYVARFLLGDDMAKAAPQVHDWFRNTVLPAHPEFAKGFDELTGMYRAWNDQGAVARVAAKVVRMERGIIPAATRGWEKLVGLFSREKWITDAAPLERAESKLLAMSGKERAKIPPSMLPTAVRAALKMNAPGTAKHFIYHAAVDPLGRRVGPGLKEVLAPVGKDIERFVTYAYARRAMSLLDRGVNPGISRADAARTVKELETPEFEAASDGITQWSGYLLDYVVSSGGLTPQSAQVIRDANPIYIPLMRHFDETFLGARGGGGKGSANLASPIKSIEGSDRSIIDPIESLLQQAEKMIMAGNKMRVARTIADLAEATPGSAWFANRVQPPTTVTVTIVADLQKQLEAAKVDLTNADMDAILNVFGIGTRPTGPDNIVSLWRNGKREFWELDPDLYRVTMDMDKDQIPAFLKLLSMPSRAIRMGAVQLKPSFGLANFERDSFDAAVYGRKVKHPLSTFGGIWSQLRNKEEAQRYEALGLDMATMYGQDQMAAARGSWELQDALKGPGTHTVHHPIQAMRGLMSGVESAPRIVEFRGVLAEAERKWGKGSEAAVIEAMNASKDLTVNFTRQGIYTTALNQIYPFLNAHVQSSSKFWRTFAHDPVGTVKRKTLRATAAGMMYVTVPSLLLWWANRDEAWWQELPEWERHNYWHFSLNGGKSIWRIPIPFQVGKVFGVMPVQFADNMYRRDPQAMNAAMWDTLASFLPFDSMASMVPAYVRPAQEATQNYEGFRQRELVPEHLQDKLPRDQYQKWTTETAKQIGKLLGVSPIKVEHVISGYTGGLGLDALRGIDGVIGMTAPENKSLWSKVGTLGTGLMGAGLQRFQSRNPLDSGGADSIQRAYNRQRLLSQKKGSNVATREELFELDRLNQAVKQMREARKDPTLPDQARNRRVLNEARQGIGKPSLDLGRSETAPEERSVEERIHRLSAENALNLFKVQPPEKRKALEPLIKGKILRSRAMTYPEQDQTLRDLGITPPADLTILREYHALNVKESAFEDAKQEADSLRRKAGVVAQRGDQRQAYDLRKQAMDLLRSKVLTPAEKTRQERLKAIEQRIRDIRQKIDDGKVPEAAGERAIDVMVRNATAKRAA